MKRLIGYTLALALVVGGCPSFSATTHAASGSQVNFNFFFGRLSPFGHWVYVPRYGQVWYPVGVPAYWQPYTNGYWAYTEFGWTWVSYDEFGWIPFHYGAWSWMPAYGWVWVPGYVWAPAWVTWRYGPSYIGWAPLPPDYGFYYGGSCPPVTVVESAWVFVPSGYIAGYDVRRVRVPAYKNVEFVRETQAITNINIVKGHVVNPGPDVTWIEKNGKAKVRRVELEQLGLKPQPVEDLKSSRQVTVATPYTSQSVPEAGDDWKGARTTNKTQVDDEGLRGKPGTSARSDREEKFDSRRPRVNQQELPERMDRYPTGAAPRPKADSDRVLTAPEPRRAPIQEPLDQPRGWRGERKADEPSYRTMPPRVYDAQPPRSPNRPDSVRPDPPSRQKPSESRPVHQDRGGNFEKTPKHMFRPPMKAPAERPVSPSGPAPGARAGGHGKRGW